MEEQVRESCGKERYLRKGTRQVTRAAGAPQKDYLQDDCRWLLTELPVSKMLPLTPEA